MSLTRCAEFAVNEVEHVTGEEKKAEDEHHETAYIR
jgi:hypothetical protein